MHKRGGTKPILFLSEYRKVIRPMGIQLYNQKMYSRTTKRCIVVQLKGISSYNERVYSRTTKRCIVVQLKGV